MTKRWPSTTLLPRALRRCVAALAALAVAGACAQGAYAGAGDLDRSFGSGGRVTTPFEGGAIGVRALEQQPGGNLLALGFLRSFDSALVRYTPDGVIDPTFGDGGTVIIPLGAGDLIVQPDAKLVTLGNSLIRFLPDGARDPSFGSGGEAPTDDGSVAFNSRHLGRQGDGRLVVAGTISRSSDPPDLVLALARFEPDGSVDESFGAGGRVSTSLGRGRVVVGNMLVQPDGKILVAAAFESASGDRNDFLLRYNPDGSLDKGFGKRGVISDLAHGLARQPDGRIVSGAGSPGELFLSRIRRDGSADPTFGRRGLAVERSRGSLRFPSLADLALDNEGRIVVAGSLPPESFTSDFGLARFSPSGALDRSFGRGGVVRTRFGDSRRKERIDALLLQPDGRLVAAGTLSSDPRTGFALARYHSEPVGSLGRVRRTVQLAAAGRTGVRVPVRCTQSCRAQVKIALDPAVARKLGLPAHLGRAAVSLGEPGSSASPTVRIGRHASARLRRAGSTRARLSVEFEASGRTAEQELRRLVLAR